MLSGHTASHDPGQLVGQGLQLDGICFTSEGDNHSSTGQPDSAGRQRQWGSCVLICLLDVQHTDHGKARQNIEVIMYLCTVRMLLLPCPDFPNVELGQTQHNGRAGGNA